MVAWALQTWVVTAIDSSAVGLQKRNNLQNHRFAAALLSNGATQLSQTHIHQRSDDALKLAKQLKVLARLTAQIDKEHVLKH
jgi:hypothetical protein